MAVVTPPPNPYAKPATNPYAPPPPPPNFWTRVRSWDNWRKPPSGYMVLTVLLAIIAAVIVFIICIWACSWLNTASVWAFSHHGLSRRFAHLFSLLRWVCVLAATVYAAYLVYHKRKAKAAATP